MLGFPCLGFCLQGIWSVALFVWRSIWIDSNLCDGSIWWIISLNHGWHDDIVCWCIMSLAVDTACNYANCAARLGQICSITVEATCILDHKAQSIYHNSKRMCRKLVCCSSSQTTVIDSECVPAYSWMSGPGLLSLSGQFLHVQHKVVSSVLWRHFLSNYAGFLMGYPFLGFNPQRA